MTSQQADLIVDRARRLCEKCLRKDVQIDFDPDMKPGDGDSSFRPGDYCLSVGTKFRRSFLGVKTEDVVEFCIAVGHELRHFEQYGLAVSLLDAKVPKDVCISHLAVRHNPIWYALNGKKNHACEADAERLGYSYGRVVLASVVGDEMAEKLLVDFCNKCVESPEAYYLKKEGRVGSWTDDSKKVSGEANGFTTLKEVNAAFEQAVKRCLKEQQPYNNLGKIGFGDEFFDAMRRGRANSEKCLDQFVMVNKTVEDGQPTLQDGMACLGLYLHPEYLESYPADLSGVMPEAVFKSPFQESAERMRAYIKDVRETRCEVINRGQPRHIAYDDKEDEKEIEKPVDPFGRADSLKRDRLREQLRGI